MGHPLSAISHRMSSPSCFLLLCTRYPFVLATRSHSALSTQHSVASSLRRFLFSKDSLEWRHRRRKLANTGQKPLCSGAMPGRFPPWWARACTYRAVKNMMAFDFGLRRRVERRSEINVE